jgi:hypothetical protein
MGAPGDKEKAVRLLKLAIEKQITSQVFCSSNMPHPINGSSSTNLSKSEYSKTTERKNLLAQCFDQASSLASV